MSQVLDASMALAWLFLRTDSGERAQAAQALTELSSTETFAPSLWWTEVASGVLRGERAGFTSTAQTNLFLDQLSRAEIIVDPEPVTSRQADIVRLARQHGLTAYDAAYLDLAVRMRCTVATFDRKLAEAVRANGLHVYGDPA